MSEKHTRQGHWTSNPGAERKHRVPKGGAAHVGPGETIAGDGCWCGEPNGHDWPGKDEGAPHPKEKP